MKEIPYCADKTCVFNSGCIERYGACSNPNVKMPLFDAAPNWPYLLTCIFRQTWEDARLTHRLARGSEKINPLAELLKCLEGEK